MPELKALAREHGLRNYSLLRKADLIALLQDNKHQAQRPPPPPPQRCARALEGPRALPPVPALRMSTWEPKCEWQNEARQPELEAPLTKRQLKCRQNRDSKLAKKFVSLDAEIGNLKSQI